MFYVTEIATGDPQIAGAAVYSYDNENAAVATFHQKLATAMRSELYTSSLLVVMDENGAIYRTERYTKPVEEAE